MSSGQCKYGLRPESAGCALKSAALQVEGYARKLAAGTGRSLKVAVTMQLIDSDILS
ncbi:hypothetical protein [Persicirhabdus sediminis]|uniref:Uncharacterized protein n=1 Tax=Persicirhabdus sediminis TaxID=454144 RepID=A0A8J7MFM9_9BACT|nr:hypothetical protein [Persicirhabdus sediminis]MBK1790924.1 hypothetical protein [Persicirhabdus sediminis]